MSLKWSDASARQRRRADGAEEVLDPFPTRAETGVVPRSTVVTFPGRVAETPCCPVGCDDGQRAHASPRPHAFRLLGRGVFRSLPTLPSAPGGCCPRLRPGSIGIGVAAVLLLILLLSKILTTDSDYYRYLKDAAGPGPAR